MSLFPTDPKKIRQRIRSYERTFRKEIEERGDIDDGYGKRYLLGPLYMLMGDLEGALASFEWFERTFPDDSGEPYHSLTWSLALHKARRDSDAFNMLYRTVFENLYFIPHLLGEKVEPLKIWHGCNLEWPSYAREMPDELRRLWDEESLAWARNVRDDPRVREKLKEFINILRQLDGEPRGEKRTRLVKQEWALRRYHFAK